MNDEWLSKYDPGIQELAKGWPLYGLQIAAYMNTSGHMLWASRIDGNENDSLVSLLGMIEVLKADLLAALHDEEEQEAEE